MDVGQFVTQGITLGKIFAVDYVEIRLPLPEREMRFLTLPEHFRDGALPAAQADVNLKAVVNGRANAWTGKIVRVESALDESTRQAVAVAQVIDPYAKRTDGTAPLKIGQFVEAQIEGQTLSDVFVIPRNAVRAGNEIILITPESRLKRMNVEPLAGDAKMIVVAADSPKSPKAGDVLCLTPIPFPADGARVLATIDGNVENPDLAGHKEPGRKAVTVPKDKAS